MPPRGDNKNTAMIQDNNSINDDSSVESDIHWDSSHHANSVTVDIDDMSAIDSEEGLGGRPNRINSYESLFAEASVESALAAEASLHGGRGGGGGGRYQQNEKFDLSCDANGAVIIDIAVKLKSGPSKKKSGGLGDNSTAGSCNSIKELLSFGKISEGHDYESDSVGSSDEESSIEGDDDDKDEDDEESSDEEDSVTDSIINGILFKTNSTDHIQGGKRVVHTEINKKTKARGSSSSRSKSKESTSSKSKSNVKKTKGATSDPLLNRFLNNRKTGAQPKKTTTARAPRKTSDNVIDSIMKQSDSLVRVSGRGQRKVGTRGGHEHPHDLSNKQTKVNASAVSTSTSTRLNTSDSLLRVQGKGNRVVRTRLNKGPNGLTITAWTDPQY